MNAINPRRKPRIAESVRDLALFRYQLRKFLRFSENAARECGVTPQQHQLLLGIAGFTGHGWATISDLSEFLQERHHSVVGLVDRAVRARLVRKDHDENDRRFVFVSLTTRGEAVLAELSRLHRREVLKMRAGLFVAAGAKRPSRPNTKGRK